MRMVSVSYVEAGSVLAQPVVDSAGRVLLRTGVVLTEVYIQRLQRLGFATLSIEDPNLEDVKIHMAIEPRTKEKAYDAVKSVRDCVETNRLLRMNELRSTVQRMIADLLGGHDVLGYLTDVKGYDEYTFHHSVNTTILALVLGLSCGYKEENLLEIGLGTLMHDIGKIKVPAAILNKKDPLTKEEFDIIRCHATDGYKLLRQNEDMGLIAAHVALQHQERWDGSGYPRGLKGKDIHEYGRIAAIADVYEALTSSRVYRGANEPYQAYEYVMANAGVLFDPQLVNIFAQHIAIYPNGSGIVLSNGQRGNVVKQNLGYPSRPWVRIFYLGEERLPVPLDYNLMDMLSLLIVGTDNR